jgi:hypothetical protein
MTRDEAIKAFHMAMFPADDASGLTTAGHDRNHLLSERAINAYVALGLLDLDEPAPASVRLADKIRSMGWLVSAKDPHNVIKTALEESGLKVVDA